MIVAMRHSTLNIRASWYALATGVAAALVIAACSGGDSGSGVASLDDDNPDGEAASSEAPLEEQVLEWTTCMREQGVDVPDPEFDADGNPQYVIQGGPDSEPGAMSQAMDACGRPPGASVGAGEGDPSEMQDAALAMAQCMRDKGIDMPDPDFNGGGQVIFDEDSGIDPNDPEFQDARADCQEELGLEGTVGGQGSGGDGPGGPVTGGLGTGD